MEHLVYSIFKMYSVLIPHSSCLILIYHYLPKFMYKKLVEILGAPQKKQCWCFFRGARCIQQVENVQCPNSNFVYFVLPRLTQSESVKVIFSLPERSSDIASFVEHPVAVSKCILLLFYFFHYYFDLKLFTQSESVRVTFFEIPGALRKNQCYSIFPGAPCIQGAFLQNVYCPDTRIFILICQDICKSNLFFNFRCTMKEKTILLFSWTTLHIAVSKCIVSFQNVFLF